MPEKENNGIEEIMPTNNNSVEETMVTNNTIQQEFGQPNTPAPVSKKKNIFPIIAIIAVLVAAIGGGFWYFKSNEKSSAKDKKEENVDVESFKDFLYNSSVDIKRGLKDLDDMFVLFDITEEPVEISGELSLGGELFKQIENDTVKFNLGLDLAKEKLEMSGILVEDGKNIADITTFGKNGKQYLKSDTLFDNIYDIGDFDVAKEFNMEELKESMKVLKDIDLPSVDDIDKIVKIVTDAMIASLDDSAIKKEESTVTINKVNEKATKHVYVVNKDNMEKFTKSMISELKNNNEFIELLAKFADVDKKDILAELEDAENDAEFEEIEPGEISIYVIDGEVAKIEFDVEGLKASFGAYDDNLELNVSTNGVILQMVGETKNDVTNLDILLNDVKLANFKIREISDDAIDFDYDVNIPASLGGTEVVLKGSIKLAYEKESDKAMSGSFDFSTDSKVDGESINFKVSAKFKLVVGGNIADYDTSKALTEVTEADETKFEQKLEDLKDSKLWQFVINNEDLFAGLLGPSIDYNEIDNGNYSY